MRILILPGYRYPGSLEEAISCGDLRNTFNLSRALVRAGHDVTVLTRSTAGDVEAGTLDGVHIVRYRPELKGLFPTSFDLSARRLRLYRSLARDADVVVASTPLSAELLARTRARLFYICSGIEDVRNYGSSLRERAQELGIRLLRDPARRRTLARATRVNTTAELESATLLRMGVPRERILTIGPGVELERYEPATPGEVEQFRRELLPPEAQGRRIVLSVSRFTPAKGILETLSAFARLKAASERDRPFLLIVGVRHSHRADYPEQVRRRIASFGLTGDVAVLENLPETRMPACYSVADVTSVFSIGYDPLPTTIIESMACGTPVVSTDFPTRTQMITHGQNGVLVPERDERAWTAFVGEILEDTPLAVRLRDAGLARVRAQFDMNRVARQYVDAFTSAA